MKTKDGITIPRYFNGEMRTILAEGCEGFWLELDTADKAGFSHAHRLTQRDLRRHVEQCDYCQNIILMEGMFNGF